MRESRNLKPCTKTTIPLRMICMDTYTAPSEKYKNPKRSKKEFSLVSAYEYRLRESKWICNSQISTVSVDEFWTWLVDKTYKKYVTWAFGYRLGDQLTVLDFWNRISDKTFSLGQFEDVYEKDGETKRVKGKGKLVTGDPPFFCFCRHNGCMVKFIDTCNYIDMTPEQIIEAAKLKFIGPQTEHEIWSKEEYQTRDAARAVFHLMEGMISQWETDQCGPWQPTAGMLSMVSLRKTIDTSRPEDMIRLDEEGKAARWEQLEQDCYYGGRITPYYRGGIRTRDYIAGHGTIHRSLSGPTIEGPIYLVDMNALYPHVMSHYAFPVRRHRRIDICHVDQLHAMVKSGIGVAASVKIATQTQLFPARRSGRVHYVKGTFWTALCGPELRKAIETDSIAQVGMVQTYTLGYPFKEWAENWLSVRSLHKQKGNIWGYIYAKMILNSLSGKWAQKGGRWIDNPSGPRVRDWGLYHTVDVDSGECIKYRYIAGHCQQWEEGGTPGFYFPILSAWISSYGRYYMDQIKDQMPEKSYLYQATDSLLVTQSGYDWLHSHGYINENKYGHFKLQDRGLWGEVYGPNHYQIEDRMTQAGVADIAVRQPNGSWVATCRDRLDSTLAKNPESAVVSRNVSLSWYNSFGHLAYDESGWWLPYEFGKTSNPDEDLIHCMD